MFLTKEGKERDGRLLAPSIKAQFEAGSAGLRRAWGEVNSHHDSKEQLGCEVYGMSSAVTLTPGCPAQSSLDADLHLGVLMENYPERWSLLELIRDQTAMASRNRKERM